MSKIPTKAQLKVLRLMREGGLHLFTFEEAVVPEAWIGTLSDHERTAVRVRTVDALVRKRMVVKKEWLGVIERYELTDDAYCELDIADGKHLVKMRCGEGNHLYEVRVETFRECRNNDMGICCFQCMARIFVNGEQKRAAQANENADSSAETRGDGFWGGLRGEGA